jgi:hypothetical protein
MMFWPSPGRTALGAATTDLIFIPEPISYSYCSQSGQGAEFRMGCMEALAKRDAALSRFKVHLAFMSEHPAACLRDAYTADWDLVGQWQDSLILGWMTTGIEPSTLGASTSAFLKRLSAYASDC